MPRANFQSRCAFFNSINSKATIENFIPAKSSSSQPYRGEVQDSPETNTVASVKRINNTKIKNNLLSIFNIINRGLEIKATKLNRTYAKMLLLLLHPQLWFSNYSFSYRN